MFRSLPRISRKWQTKISVTVSRTKSNARRLCHRSYCNSVSPKAVYTTQHRQHQNRHQNNNHNGYYSYNSSPLIAIFLFLSSVGCSSYSSLTSRKHTVNAFRITDDDEDHDLHEKEVNPHPEWQVGERLNSTKIPSYSRKEVQEHSTPKSLWLTYRHGVYDLTKFADHHPGAVERLLLACMNDNEICPWWNQLGYHNVKSVHTLLERHRIGNLNSDDVKECELKKPDVPFVLREARRELNDTAFSYSPFIAETPTKQLNDYYYTPPQYHYVRNHFKTPTHLNWSSTFTLKGSGVPKRVDIPGFLGDIDDDDDDDIYGGDDEETSGQTLSYKDLLSLPSIERDVYLQCGGHRRIEFDDFGETKGSKWNIGAISNGKYRGVLLVDLFKYAGVNMKYLYQNIDKFHVWFIGADNGPDGSQYGVSIPLYKVLDPRGDVMLAYSYNNKPLTHDHGYPVRILVPGWVGARSVKWIEEIKISEKECDMLSFTKSYRMTKGLGQEIRDLPVNSSVHSPENGDVININELQQNDNILTIRGEAHSGDGRGIIRVDISLDDGESWHDAVLLGDVSSRYNTKIWNWTKWRCDVNLTDIILDYDQYKPEKTSFTIQCRAMDLSHNRQPQSSKPDISHNEKGYGANSYHTIKVRLDHILVK